jgi:hypothetical protein
MKIKWRIVQNAIRFQAIVLKYYVQKNTILGSSELLTCEECGATFSTIDALNEHRKAEREDEKLRNAGFADG